MIYNVFGSKSSLDLDIAVAVSVLPKPLPDRLNYRRKIQLDMKSLITTNKPLNVNVVVVTEGIVTDCIVGIPDEVNNSLYYTYDLHRQEYPLIIKKLVKRDIPKKINRVARSILSLFTRTEHRVYIKQMLRGFDTTKMITGILTIPLYKYADSLKKNPYDSTKTIAFQISQLYLLYDGIEVYTKEGIISKLPFMEDYIFRRKIMDKCLYDFIVDTLKN